MVDSSCGGTFLHKTADEAWDLFENLSDNSQQHTTSSRVGTSRQIGNRGMFEVSQIVDLSMKVDALSKKFDQLLALNTLPTNSTNVQNRMTHIQTRTIQAGEITWRQQGGEVQLGQQQYQQNRQSGMTTPPGFQSQSILVIQ
ncbi:hypothetical protein M9H77_02958 [Catharanthus roseus]|uniref:Uncharacterized protein n=1 Tax=Catharanthus roseus TaxID=4058 RepID=A0ACC0CA34_CATRO|nr:hypothetical protein M9H77_02958 [Catharanthus roseus]